ncbi:unnamed protein product [Mytilus edulis]|uniref:Uncharacterized protein n=1 Tax=Mytilus edulis TaxID=6550 RepID=A0A8S3QDX4_MYTED|nr:unnamed protein product [Mytilus edulis]
MQQPQQQGWEVDRRYEDIMSLNYGRNPFVQKNDINNENVYRFKFRGKDVCITLTQCHHVLYMKDILYMHVDGNGKTEWCDAATPILDKQCERFQSGKLQIPGADTGEPLVSEEKFHECFAIPYAYGTNGTEWSNETILLYKYSSNATTKYWHIPEDTWKKIVNTNKHAEKTMIEDLEDIHDYLTIQPDDNEGSYKAILSVEVILSYSPCGECSQALCRIKKKMDEKVKFKITFSNFYKHTEEGYVKEGIDNMEGLKDLLQSGIKLDVFSDDNWHYFFNAAGLVTRRQKREKDDKKILQYLEGVAIEQDLRKNRLL